MANEIEMINVSGIDYEVVDATARININSLDERVDIVEGLCDTFATKNELRAVRQDLESSFQDGVDLIAEACDDRGSTPAGQYPYTPQAVADAIRAIPYGGGPCYSMIPQEIHRHGSDWCCAEYRPYIIIDKDVDIFVAHILPISETNSISINIDVDLYSYYTGTIDFSLVIDNNSAVIPNIGSVTITETYTYTKCTISYTFSTPLTMEYHTLSVRPSAEYSFSAEGYQFMCSVYGTGFTAVEYPGMYLINSNFVNFIPSNFTIPNNPPNNPIVNTLAHNNLGNPCDMETIVDAMDSCSADFDSGKSFYFKGCSGYEYWDEKPGCGGQQVYVPINSADTLTFGNGKFTYTHTKRVFSDDDYESCYEVHSFLMPFINKLFAAGNYINIHGTITSMGGQPTYQVDNCRPIVIMREDEVTIHNQIDGNTLDWSSYYQGDQFILSVNVSNINSNYINFIGLYFNIRTNQDPFTIEIDKIQVTEHPQDSGGGQPC